MKAGPTKPGWYWVRFTDRDDWTIDRVNVNPTSGTRNWWAYGGRVEDRELVAWEGPLPPPSKTGVPPKAPLVLNEVPSGEYVAPSNPGPRSYLARTRKADDDAGRDSDTRRTGSVPTQTRNTSVADSTHTENSERDRSLPVGVYTLYGQRVIVVGIEKRGRGYAYSIANEATPTRTRFVAVTEWNKEVRRA